MGKTSRLACRGSRECRRRMETDRAFAGSFDGVLRSNTQADRITLDACRRPRRAQPMGSNPSRNAGVELFTLDACGRPGHAQPVASDPSRNAGLEGDGSTMVG
jgi:hypothetical protein